MNLRQAYLGIIKAYPGGWDAMAAALGMTRDALENRIYEREGQRLHVDTALQMQAFAGVTYFSEAIATQGHGVFTKLVNGGDIDREDLQAKFHELYIEFGELSQKYTVATEDNSISKKEREQLEAAADKIHQTIQELMNLMFQVFCASKHERATAKRSGVDGQ